MPVVPATQEAELGESLESERSRLRQAMIMPLHSKRSNKDQSRNKVETKKTIEKNTEMKSCFFEKINKIDRLRKETNAKK